MVGGKKQIQKALVLKYRNRVWQGRENQSLPSPAWRGARYSLQKTNLPPHFQARTRKVNGRRKDG